MIARINWKPTTKDLRLFGLTILIGFTIIGGIVYGVGKPSLAQALWMGAGAIGLIAILLPPLSKPFYFTWMGIAFVMGTIISFIIIAIIYYLIITPVALFMKIIGRDALNLKKESLTGGTYWHDHPSMKNKESYSRLF